VQTLLQIVYFYNPLLWLANWAIRRVREQAVDEAVQVTLGEKAGQYPETLLNVARLAFERPVLSLRLIGVVESKSALAGRIKRLLTRPIPKTAKLGIIGSALVMLLAAILLPMAKAKDTEPGFVIKGAVTNAQTGKPVAGAKVGDAEQYAGGKYGAVTDSSGNYSYKTWYEEHNVKCEASGYKTENKILLTKVLGSEKEKVIDFALMTDNSSDKVNSIKVYDVNKNVTEFDQKEDLLTPESAYAAINRVSAAGDANGWERVSIKQLAESFAKGKEKMKVEPQWAKVLLNAKILEVRICNGNNAIVIAQLLQEFSSEPIRKPIDIRHLKLENGKWLSAGNDRVWTIEEARAQFDSQCNNMKGKNDNDKKAMNPAEIVIAAAEFGDKSESDSNAAKAGRSSDIELSHDSGKQAGMLSIEGSGHCVKFSAPKEGLFLKEIKIYGSRYGEYEPPKEDFHVWLCDPNFEVIKEFSFPYSEFRMRGMPRWVELNTEPQTPLPPQFIICVGFDPHQTKGVHMYYDGRENNDSFTGLPGSALEPFKKGNWMIRVTAGEKGPTKPRAKAPDAQTPPKIIGTNPIAFKSDVLPQLDKLTVTFNQTMTDKSWSWVQMDNHFPNTTGKPYYDSVRKTCSLPVKLEPGNAYLVAFNVKPYIGFVNSQGIAARPYVLVFATKDRDGKPTPIPQDMIEKAKYINDQNQTD
jgi:hypothetical protein